MIDTLASAFEVACAKFAENHNGASPNDTISNGIAARMIKCAEAGEWDANRIIDFGLKGTGRAAA